MFMRRRSRKGVLVLCAIVLSTLSLSADHPAKTERLLVPNSPTTMSVTSSPTPASEASLTNASIEANQSPLTMEREQPAEDARETAARKRKRQKKGSASSDMSWVQLQKRYPSTYFLGGPRTNRRVALTFDDVPDLKYTPQVLDILAKYKVRATFFVVGTRAAAYPSVVRRMQREGHMIGNHSYNHPVFSKLTQYQFQKQIMQTDAVLRPIIGYSPRFIRPPYGEIMPKQIEWARRNGFAIVNWDVDSQDWKGIGSQLVIRNVKSTLQSGSIILQHAGGSEDLSGTVNALPRLIRLLQSKGYEIVPLPELLNRSVGRTKP